MIPKEKAEQLIKKYLDIDWWITENYDMEDWLCDYTPKEAKEFAKTLAKDGWEGAMCVCPRSYYYIGKRVNNSVKLKFRKTADLLCVGFEEGEGKYEGMIGALILKDSKGRMVNVGSGLEDYQRNSKCKADYLGSVIEIEYEQIIDTYIQPTFIRVRTDKTTNEID